jgi:DNA-binding response OmpR family regulator
MRTRQVTVHGCLIELSSLEYGLLEHLMLRAGETVSRIALAQRHYGEDDELLSDGAYFFSVAR